MKELEKAYIAGYLDDLYFVSLLKQFDTYHQRTRFKIRKRFKDHNDISLRFIEHFYEAEVRPSKGSFFIYFKPHSFIFLLEDILPYLVVNEERAKILLEVSKMKEELEASNNNSVYDVYIEYLDRQSKANSTNIDKLKGFDDKILASYLAGLVDRNSSFFFKKSDRGFYNNQITISNPSETLLNFIRDKFGSKGNPFRGKIDIPSLEPLGRLLKLIAPYSKNKRNTIKAHLNFIELRQSKLQYLEVDRFIRASKEPLPASFKECTDCGYLLFIDNFYYNKNTSDNLSCYCKNCQSNQRAEYYVSNTEKVKASVRRYKIKNGDKIIARSKLPHNKLKRNHRKRVKDLLKDNRDKSTSIGCSGLFLQKYIEEQWLEGMSWENYSGHSKKYPYWEIDHKKALCTFDLTNDNEKRVAFNYTNLRPIWIAEHKEKNKKDLKIKYRPPTLKPDNKGTKDISR